MKPGDAVWVGPESPEWNAILTRIGHDIYHTAAYVALSARYEGGEPVGLLYEDCSGVFFVPLLLRSLTALGSPDLFDATSSYGYPGPIVVAADDDTAFVERAIAAILVSLERKGVVSLFVRMNPFVNIPQAPLRRFGTLVEHGHSVFIDLTEAPDELWQQIRKGHRQDIVRAAQAGVVVSMDWNALDDFIVLYQETMRRVGAASFYFFDDQYFRDLRTGLGSTVHLCVARVGEETAGAALFSESCGIVQYMFSATDDRYAHLAPSKSIIEYTRRWAAMRQNRLLHLGGGVGSMVDSLYRFKAGFGPRRASFRTWRVIISAERFRELVEVTPLRGDAPGGGAEGFFPPYRAATAAKRC